MPINDKVRPVKDNHSIKEAVIGIFLATPIIKPERFKDLISSDFKAIFQLFEPLTQVQFNLQALPGSAPNGYTELLSNAGFKFTSFENGLPGRVLQGLNDSASGRTFISYHALNYSRWAPYLSSYMEVISAIDKFNAGFFVTAISLHYIDQFLWDINSDVDHKLLFNSGAGFLPKEFFDSSVSQYSIIMEKEIDGRKYLDRLEIKVERSIIPGITISHNVTQVLPDMVSLEELLREAEFHHSLAAMHKHNKDILNDMLTEEVAKMINL